MNDRQLAYFKQKLLDWKDDILRETRETVSHMQTATLNHPDLADRASDETDRSLELRTRDRQRKLIAKIEAALRRIEEGEYRGADRPRPPRSPPHRHPRRRGPGTSRTPGTRASGRVIPDRRTLAPLALGRHWV